MCFLENIFFFIYTYDTQRIHKRKKNSAIPCKIYWFDNKQKRIFVEIFAQKKVFLCLFILFKYLQKFKFIAFLMQVPFTI